MASSPSRLAMLASHVVDGRYDPRGGGQGLRARLAVICAEVSAAIEAGARLIILSDRAREVPGGRPPGPTLIPIPSLLLTGAVHHHLIKQNANGRPDKR
jgi:glutamate synthase (NADPH/NADH) large chain